MKSLVLEELLLTVNRLGSEMFMFVGLDHVWTFVCPSASYKVSDFFPELSST